MYYNFKFVNDENTCIQCFNEKTYGDMMLRLLKDYDSIMFRYMRGKIGGFDSDELYIFRKALPKCFLKLLDSQKNDVTTLKVNACRKLMRFIEKHSNIDADYDICCLYETLDYAIIENIDICIIISDTPFK